MICNSYNFYCIQTKKMMNILRTLVNTCAKVDTKKFLSFFEKDPPKYLTHIISNLNK